MPKIHVVGDSHANFGWNSIPETCIHWRGSRLCYSFGVRGDAELVCTFTPGDFLVFSFGEIDCRCHIKKHITDGHEPIINSIVDMYFARISQIIGRLDGVRTGVYNILPPAEKAVSKENPEFPFLGSDAERQVYTRYFNDRLRAKCAEFGYLFVDVYDAYTGPNGCLDSSKSDGIVHIQDPIHLQEFVDKHMIISESSYLDI
jgi:hypothetical protein